MANLNAPRGLRPVRHRNGACIVTNEYSIASGYTENIFRGDPVERTGTTNQIAVAAADNPDNLGVFAGCRYKTNGRWVFSNYWPDDQAADAVVAYVWDDPQIIYEAQISTLAVTDIGAGFQWVLGTGSTATGQSSTYLDQSTTGTADVQLRVERLVPRADNAIGAYAKVEVSFMEHALANVVAGVGGI